MGFTEFHVWPAWGSKSTFVKVRQRSQVSLNAESQQSCSFFKSSFVKVPKGHAKISSYIPFTVPVTSPVSPEGCNVLMVSPCQFCTFLQFWLVKVCRNVAVIKQTNNGSYSWGGDCLGLQSFPNLNQVLSHNVHIKQSTHCLAATWLNIGIMQLAKQVKIWLTGRNHVKNRIQAV